MWSAHWYYIVAIMVVEHFCWCARCDASGLLVSLACIVRGIRGQWAKQQNATSSGPNLLVCALAVPLQYGDRQRYAQTRGRRHAALHRTTPVGLLHATYSQNGSSPRRGHMPLERPLWGNGPLERPLEVMGHWCRSSLPSDRGVGVCERRRPPTSLLCTNTCGGLKVMEMALGP